MNSAKAFQACGVSQQPRSTFVGSSDRGQVDIIDFSRNNRMTKRRELMEQPEAVRSQSRHVE